MRQRGLNQQQLARQSDVSDSEVSRILAQKSQPGLENAYRLARAVGVSLDYLVDDTLDQPPDENPQRFEDVEREILRLCRDMGYAEAANILRIISMLGPTLALQRLIAAKPLIEPIEPATKSHGHMGSGMGAFAQSG